MGHVGDRTHSQFAAALAGAVLGVVGLLGFVPGLTTHYGRLGLVGHASWAKLFALFQTSALQNVVHLAFGIVGLILALTVDGARRFLLGGGIVSLLLWLLGVVGAGSWVPLNADDNWLHLLLGIALLGLGSPGRATAPAPEAG